MKLLAIDSSGMVASAAVVEDDRVLAEFNVNNKKTHSQTLLPMIDTLKSILNLELDSLDAIAISKGPGSFTGLRIGSATAKGLALALKKPIVEISTLEAMAYQLYGCENVICPIMDARRNQVYTGVYRFENDDIVTVLEDRPMDILKLIEYLNSLNEPVIFLGDGVPVYEETIEKELKVKARFAKAFQNRQRASALGILAEKYFEDGKAIDSAMHRPEYLRLSQAERERMERSDA